MDRTTPPRDATRQAIDSCGPAAGRDRPSRLLRSPILAALFLALALPTVLVQVYLTPPMQVADEENHFLRVLQVASGHAFGRVLGPGFAGGLLDPAGAALAHGFDPLKFHPEVKLDLGAYGTASTLRWGSGPPVATAFPNTAIYPFFLYLPAGVAVALAKASDWTVLNSFYLGRLATATLSVGLAALALAVCGRGRTLLFVILCFPMTLSLFASVSQDALSIALGAVASAVWSGYAARGAPMPARARAGVALALGMVAAARLPMVLLYPLALLPTRSSPASGRRLRIADGLAAAAGIVPLAIGLYGTHVAKVGFREDAGVSDAGQLRWVTSHPIDAIDALARTLWDNGAAYLHEMVGVLGWLDLELPAGFYAWMGLCFAAALMLDAASSDRSVPGFWRAIPLAGALAAAVGVFEALYLTWTPVGAPIIEGVQGRYFLVPLIVIAVSLPGVGAIAPRWSSRLEGLRFALCAAVALADLWIVPTSLLHRYYG